MVGYSTAPQMEFAVKEEVSDELEAVQSIFEKDFSFQVDKNSIM